MEGIYHPRGVGGGGDHEPTHSRDKGGNNVGYSPERLPVDNPLIWVYRGLRGGGVTPGVGRGPAPGRSRGGGGIREANGSAITKQ